MLLFSLFALPPVDQVVELYSIHSEKLLELKRAANSSEPLLIPDTIEKGLYLLMVRTSENSWRSSLMLKIN